MTGLDPYVPITVSIQPYTYWGINRTTTVTIRSPMAGRLYGLIIYKVIIGEFRVCNTVA